MKRIRVLNALLLVALLPALGFAQQPAKVEHLKDGVSVLTDSAGRRIACVGNACGTSVGPLGATSALTSRVIASMLSSQTSTLDLGSASFTPSLNYSESMTLGTGNDGFQIVYADSGTIAASDSTTYDLAGAITDAFGNTFTCATLKGVMVTAPSTNTNDVLVGGATAGQIAWMTDGTDTLGTAIVRPGGVLLWMAPRTGITVTNTTRDKMRLRNSAGTSGVKYLAQFLCR